MNRGIKWPPGTEIRPFIAGEVGIIARARRGETLTAEEWEKLPAWMKNRIRKPAAEVRDQRSEVGGLLALAEERRPICLACDRLQEAHQTGVNCHCNGERKCSNFVRFDKVCPLGKWKRKVLLRHWLSPGDVLVMTAAVRDIAKEHRSTFELAVDTSAGEIWEHNPYVRRMSREQAIAEGFEVIDAEYPSIHQSNQSGKHFIQAFREDIGKALGVQIPEGRLAGEVYLSEVEKSEASQVEREFGHRGPFWILMAPGGKTDFTAKWWNPVEAQKVVDHFKGRITFVRCGELSHWHPPIQGTLDLVGKTNLRQFIRLMHHAEGVICPVTFAMHLAAAVETKDEQARKCVVIAGGREPATWERYPGHEFLHCVGRMDCCRGGGCWKGRAQQIGDGDGKDQDLCSQRVEVDYPYGNGKLYLAGCMAEITAGQVIAAVERQMAGVRTIRHHHGLGDAVYFALQLQLYKRRGCRLLISEESDRNIILQAAGVPFTNENVGEEHSWIEAPSLHEVGGAYMLANKACLNLSRHPMPNIGTPAELADEFSRVEIDVRPFIPERAMDDARMAINGLRRPLILIHSKGNSGQDVKSIPDALMPEIYERVLSMTGGSLFLLDWDDRVPRMQDARVRHLLDDWSRIDLDRMFALMSMADLMIGIDSGPLHASRLCGLAAIGVWRNDWYHPARYSLPRREQINLVIPLAVNAMFAEAYNIREFRSREVDPELVAETAAQMLASRQNDGVTVGA